MCVASAPKVPKPTPVIERQAYKNAPSRESLGSGADPASRRRVIMGVATSARGDMSAASTTKRVMTGGDQQIMPGLSGGGTVTGTTPSNGGASSSANVIPFPAQGVGAGVVDRPQAFSGANFRDIISSVAYRTRKTGAI